MNKYETITVTPILYNANGKVWRFHFINKDNDDVICLKIGVDSNGENTAIAVLEEPTPEGSCSTKAMKNGQPLLEQLELFFSTFTGDYAPASLAGSISLILKGFVNQEPLAADEIAFIKAEYLELGDEDNSEKEVRLAEHVVLTSGNMEKILKAWMGAQ